MIETDSLLSPDSRIAADPIHAFLLACLCSRRQVGALETARSLARAPDFDWTAVHEAATQELLAPLTVGWLQLPKEASTAFVMGFVRRDYGAAGLLNMQLSPLQAVVALVTITLFVPCIAQFSVMIKERGAKTADRVPTTISAIPRLMRCH